MYVTRILSSQKYTDLESLICGFLRLKFLEGVLFPAKLHIGIEDSLTLNSSEEFNLKMLPKEYFGESLLYFEIHGENGTKISMNIGIGDIAKSHNSINFKFDGQHLKTGTIKLRELISFFKESVVHLSAYSGTIYEQEAAMRVSEENWPNNFYTYEGIAYPLSLQWVNFYGKPMIEFFGNERFNNLKACSEKFAFQEGIIVLLQEEPYDDTNLEHRHRRERAERELHFSDLFAK